MKLRAFTLATAVVATLGLTAGSAQASIITLSGSAFNTGPVEIKGDGDSIDADAFGEGFLSLGACAFGGINTVCTITGSYLLDAAASDPDIADGTFSLRLVYAGNGYSPWRIEQQSTGSNTIVGLGLNGAHLELDLFPIVGPSWSETTPDVGLGFNFVGASCVGVAVCSVSNVVNTPGATITGPANLTMTLVTAPAAVPEPGSLLLLGSGLAAAVVAARRRRS